MHGDTKNKRSANRSWLRAETTGRRAGRLVLSALAVQTVSAGAHAQEPVPAQPGSSTEPLLPPREPARKVLHALGAHATLSNFDAGGGLSYRLRLPSGMQLGLEARGVAVRDAYVDGYAATGGLSAGGSALLMIPVVQKGPLDLHFRVSLGMRATSVDETTGPDKSSSTFLTELGPVVNVRVAPSLTLRTGWLQLTNFQVTPAFANETLGQVLLAGVAVPVTSNLQLHADVETGGLFGFDGDGGKYLLRGFVGARWVFGGAAGSWLSF